MSPKAPARYTAAGLQNIITQLTAWQEAAEEIADNEYSKDYPNEERGEKYQARADALRSAIEELEAIEE